MGTDITTSTTAYMSLLLLLVLPLLVEGTVAQGEPADSYRGNCGLPPASTEKFNFNALVNRWYAQYQYKVPGLSDLGCFSSRMSRTASNEWNQTGNFSKVPKFPVQAHITLYGNRYNKVYQGIWNCQFSGPGNLVYLCNDFYITHTCFLGYEASVIYTSVKEPNDKLLKEIWKVVDDHPEVKRRKYKKVVC